MTPLTRASTHRASEDAHEKEVATMHLEDQPQFGISPEDRRFLEGFTEEAKKRVLRKVTQIEILFQSKENPLTDHFLGRCMRKRSHINETISSLTFM